MPRRQDRIGMRFFRLFIPFTIFYMKNFILREIYGNIIPGGRFTENHIDVKFSNENHHEVKFPGKNWSLSTFYIRECTFSA